MEPNRTDQLTEHEKKILEPYVTCVETSVFSLKNLNPEIIGAALARYSRAPTGFKETVAREFLNADGSPNQEKGSQMIDRVVNKYGDDSVAELAVAPICIEEVSNLMTKIIEDRRIGGSPIEESTRYVLYDTKRNEQWRYIRPRNIMNSGLGKEFINVMDFIFSAYAEMVEPMQELFRKRLPKKDFSIEVERSEGTVQAKLADLKNDDERKAHRIAYNFTIRSAACDVIRCILPACTKANMGLVGNGRFFSGLISKLLTQSLDEGWVLAENLRQALNHQIPTFIKRAGASKYQAKIQTRMKEICKEIFHGIVIDQSPEVILLGNEDFNIELIASMIFPYVQHPTKQIRKVVKNLSQDKREEIRLAYFGERASKRDRPGRALEYGYPIQFDLTAGFAEYRDLQRHRMLTQQRQNLGVTLGYSVPSEIEEIEKEDLVRECFARAESLNSDLIREGMEEEAQYTTLFNHFIRWNVGMNLRELSHLTELRTQRAGHPKYRRLTQTMTRLYLANRPEMKPLFNFVDYNDYDDGIARAEQEARTARKSLTKGVFDDMD
tara:strand:- start:4802 stop:6457 length:1656 start_codon:yes stop_codon:yes gene_type:complete